MLQVTADSFGSLHRARTIFSPLLRILGYLKYSILLCTDYICLFNAPPVWQSPLRLFLPISCGSHGGNLQRHRLWQGVPSLSFGGVAAPRPPMSSAAVPPSCRWASPDHVCPWDGHYGSACLLASMMLNPQGCFFRGYKTLNHAAGCNRRNLPSGQGRRSRKRLRKCTASTQN